MRSGRALWSRAKLEAVLKWAGAEVAGIKISTIVADVADYASLVAMCQRAKVVLNCVGPFRFYGRQVVEAVLEAGADYLDICGEPEFMEAMEADYGARARERGSLVISACGFDSVPADLGVLRAAQGFLPPSAPSSVDSFLTLRAKGPMRINFGTWESLVEGIASASQLRKLRASRPKPARLSIPGPPPQRSMKPYKEPATQSYALPFPGADASVVKRTMLTLATATPATPPGTATPGASAAAPSLPDAEHAGREQQGQQKEGEGKGAGEELPASSNAPHAPFRPVHYAAYFTVRARWQVWLFVVLGLLVQRVAQFAWGRRLLKRFPGAFTYGLFSRQGPTQEMMDGTSFEMLFVAKGYSDASKLPAAPREAALVPPDRRIVSVIRAPEPGYVATPIIMVQCCFCLLESRGQLPGGGVFTPGSVFHSTNLISRLHGHGIQFIQLRDELI
eukprot:jgi/Mesen1/9162/ME000591S08484